MVSWISPSIFTSAKSVCRLTIRRSFCAPSTVSVTLFSLAFCFAKYRSFISTVPSISSTVRVRVVASSSAVKLILGSLTPILPLNSLLANVPSMSMLVYFWLSYVTSFMCPLAFIAAICLPSSKLPLMLRSHLNIPRVLSFRIRAKFRPSVLISAFNSASRLLLFSYAALILAAPALLVSMSALTL